MVLFFKIGRKMLMENNYIIPPTLLSFLVLIEVNSSEDDLQDLSDLLLEVRSSVPSPDMLPEASMPNESGQLLILGFT